MRKKIEVVKHEAEKAKDAAKENWEKLLRSKAELENVRKRSAQEVDKARKYSVEKALNALFPVADSLEKALEVEGDSPQIQSMRKGVEMTLKMLLDALSKSGLVQINPLGEEFDPAFHEAMSMAPSNDVAANHVMDVMQCGYVLNGRLVRPARVIVSSGNPG